MTNKEVQALSLGITDKGIICLCKKNRAGKAVPVREIRPDEAAQICATLYTLNTLVHPDQQVMYLPYNEGKVLAITVVDAAPDNTHE